MLDSRSAALLKLINERCSEGSYKVLEIADVIQSLPEKLGMDDVSLKQTVNFLKEREYLSVKYSDGVEYCLCPLPKGRQYAESDDNKEKVNKEIILEKSAFFPAFFGGFLGAAIVGIIVAALLYFKII